MRFCRRPRKQHELFHDRATAASGEVPARPTSTGTVPTTRPATPRGCRCGWPSADGATTLTPTARPGTGTLKYAPVFPERFASLAHTGGFMTDFVARYD